MVKRKNKGISQFILNFCKTISSEKPILIPLRPAVAKPVNECFTIVPKHILSYGGKQKIGWNILVWRKVLIEAEFHSVWESPEGEIIDISPKIYEADFVVFLPDPTKNYTGSQVNNIRKSLSTNRNVRKYISFFDEYFRHTNEGDLADYHGEIAIEREFIDKYKFMVELERELVSKFGNDRGISISGRFVKYHKNP